MRAIIAFALASLIALTACGQTGALVLPDDPNARPPAPADPLDFPGRSMDKDEDRK